MGWALGSSGFDLARDILAITVNRWLHGYSYQYNSRFDKFWLEGGKRPCMAGRQPFGRVTIAMGMRPCVLIRMPPSIRPPAVQELTA